MADKSEIGYLLKFYGHCQKKQKGIGPRMGNNSTYGGDEYMILANSFHSEGGFST